MAKPATAVCEVLPPLPAKGIDMDALTTALNAGKSGEDAIAEAVASPAAPEASSEPEATAPAPIPEITE